MDSTAPATATTTVNRVVTFLGAVALLGVAGMILLAMLSKPVPDNLTNVTVAAVAAEAALLASSRSVDPDAVQRAGYQAAVQDVSELDPDLPHPTPGPVPAPAAAVAPRGPAGWPPQPWPAPPPGAVPYQPQHVAQVQVAPPPPGPPVG